MIIRPSLVLAAVIALVIPALAQRPIVIDGRKLPGMTEVTGADLPAYQVWRFAFRMLRNVNLKPGRPRSFTFIARLSPEQWDLILETATRSAEAEVASWERQKKVLAEMQAGGRDAIRDHAEIQRTLWDIDYGQRVTTLQERDALLLQLTPEAREAFAAWVEELRTGMASTVPTAELDAYQLPS
jgi:hypothetical protein